MTDWLACFSYLQPSSTYESMYDVLLQNASPVIGVFKSVRCPWLATEGITAAWGVVVLREFNTDYQQSLQDQ